MRRLLGSGLGPAGCAYDPKVCELALDEIDRAVAELDRVGEEKDLVQRRQQPERAGEHEADRRQHRVAPAGHACDADDEDGADHERGLEHVAQAAVGDRRHPLWRR